MIVIRDPKTFYFDFDWPKDVEMNLKHEIEYIIKINAPLAQKKIKMRRNNYYPNISMETIFMNTERSKTSELHKLVLNLSQRLDFQKVQINMLLFFSVMTA